MLELARYRCLPAQFTRRGGRMLSEVVTAWIDRFIAEYGKSPLPRYGVFGERRPLACHVWRLAKRSSRQSNVSIISRL